MSSCQRIPVRDPGSNGPNGCGDQRAPGWSAQPTPPPRDAHRLLITPAARAEVVSRGRRLPSASADGRAIRRADAVEYLRELDDADALTSGAARGQRLGPSDLMPVAGAGLGYLSTSADVLLSDGQAQWKLADVVEACVHEALDYGSVDVTVCSFDSNTRAERIVHLTRAEQLGPAQIERALERGTDVNVGRSESTANSESSTLSLLIFDGSGLEMGELVGANDGVVVVIGAPRPKVVPIDLGDGDFGVGVRMVACLSVTMRDGVSPAVLSTLVNSLSAVLVESAGRVDTRSTSMSSRNSGWR